MSNNLKRSEYLFDAKKNFFDLGIVKLFFLTITTASLFCFATIAFNTSLRSDWSYLGFNNFVEIFKVPISVLALNIPVIAILGAFHKSEQTRLQIQLSDGQNLFANYFKHIEEFVKYIEKYEGKVQEFRCDARRLHKKLFPNAAIGDYDISDEIALQINELIDYSKTIVVGFDDGEHSELQDLDSVIISNIKLIDSKSVPLDFGFFYAEHAHFDNPINGGSNFAELFVAFANRVEFILSYYDFISYVISFNHSKKIRAESYRVLNSISFSNYKVYFSRYFSGRHGNYEISGRYYLRQLREINKEFLFDFLSLINNDSTR